MAKSERNKLIVLDCETGSHTLSEIAEKYNVSHQRISQIYIAATGKGYQLRVNKIREQRQAKREAYKKRLLGYCLSVDCGKPLYANTVAGKGGPGGRKYCKEHTLLERYKGRDTSVKLKCHGCGDPFYPYRLRTAPSQPKNRYFYCKPSCYRAPGRSGYTKSDEALLR
jgi:hypothetical protein